MSKYSFDLYCIIKLFFISMRLLPFLCLGDISVAGNMTLRVSFTSALTVSANCYSYISAYVVK